MNCEHKRLETFNDWNVSFINKNKMAMFGLYYSGYKDLVLCHYCNVELLNWEDGDDIWTEHRRWSPYCKFLNGESTDNVPIDNMLLKKFIQPKSRDIVTDLITQQSQTTEKITNARFHLEKSQTITSITNDNNNNNNLNCKICYDNVLNAVFVPCGHAVACTTCALKIESCPMCRRQDCTVIQLYVAQ